MIELFFKTPADLNKWLAKNHTSEQELWVCYYKKHTGKQTLTWAESVEEALCYGWIDGIKKTRDDESYKVRFTPRRKTSIWSPTNLKTIKKLISEDRIKPAGLEIYKLRKKGHADPYKLMKKEFVLDEEYMKQMQSDSTAIEYFNNLPPGYKKQMMRWIMTAKQEVTRDRRFKLFFDSCVEKRRMS